MLAAGLLTAAALVALGRGRTGPAAADPSGSRAAPDDAAHRVPNPLLKELLAEEDDGESEDDPALSALCQDFVGKPNPYRAPTPNVDTIVGDATIGTGSQAGCSSAQNETSIAVNPYDPRNIVAGANDHRLFVPREQRNDSTGWAYASRDGGRTWTDTVLPGLTAATGATGALVAMDAVGDPVIAFGPRNTVYYGNIVASSRGGASWSVSVVGTPQDEVFSAVATVAGVVAVSAYTRHWDAAGIGLDYAYWSGSGWTGWDRYGGSPVRRTRGCSSSRPTRPTRTRRSRVCSSATTQRSRWARTCGSTRAGPISAAGRG